jgi:hypothetical protein
MLTLRGRVDAAQRARLADAIEELVAAEQALDALLTYQQRRIACDAVDLPRQLRRIPHVGALAVQLKITLPASDHIGSVCEQLLEQSALADQAGVYTQSYDCQCARLGSCGACAGFFAERPQLL